MHLLQVNLYTVPFGLGAGEGAEYLTMIVPRNDVRTGSCKRRDDTIPSPNGELNLTAVFYIASEPVDEAGRPVIAPEIVLLAGDG
jgi:hypothetical protein